ncbi:TetR/AcrR family transcriptional regulator [Bryobacter aggregatus]|uniref:TetR/AcrR family transcriptional regulator n=1 Tax=Bryobacter aggregatus TaxID=360054 RepID=UPI0004E1C0C2|nr:TetR/AcrR family transcriptional regulator [Bryobacter aggregatus]
MKKHGYHHGDLRAALVTAAIRLVAEKGPRGFTAQDAAKLAGVVPSALYRHFADKEALLAAAAEEGFDQLRESIGKTKSLEELGLAYLQFAVQQRGHFEIMFLAGIEPSAFPTLGRSATAAFDAFAEAVRSASQAGVDLEIRLAGLWSLFHGFSLLAHGGDLGRVGFRRSPEELLQAAIRRFLATE